MRITAGRIIAVGATVIAAGLVTTAMASEARDGGSSARVTMRDAAGNSVGTVRFVRAGDGTAVRVNLQLDPATVGASTYHGFHVHANNDPANGEGCVADPATPNTTWFVSADGHWKIDGQNHSAHLGDMVSLYVTADGRVDTQFTLDRFAPAELAGRAVIIHAGPDNFGNVPTGTALNQYTANGPDATTLTANTGNAGARIACGVVGAR